MLKPQTASTPKPEILKPRSPKALHPKALNPKALRYSSSLKPQLSLEVRGTWSLYEASVFYRDLGLLGLGLRGLGFRAVGVWGLWVQGFRLLGFRVWGFGAAGLRFRVSRLAHIGGVVAWFVFAEDPGFG